MSDHLVVSLPQFPETKVLVTVFSNVENASHIKSQLILANEKYDYSFIDASVILTVEQLLLGIHKTLLDQESNSMKSKTINSELILNLSPFTGILDSFKKIGLTDKTVSLVLCKFLTQDSQEDVTAYLENLRQIVKGDISPVNDEVLAKLADLPKVRKIFKLNQIADNDNVGRLSRIIVGITQLK